MTDVQTQIYGVVLPLDLAYRARIVAASLGKSRSKLMRDLLLDYLRKYESNETINPHVQKVGSNLSQVADKE